MTLKELLTVLLFSFAIAGQMRAQEVVVVREANPAEQVEPVFEGTDSDLETATGTKSQVLKKKSTSTTPTLKQMRMGGALAAERQKKQTPAEQTNSVGRSSLQGPKAATLAKRQKSEVRAEQTGAPRTHTSKTTNPEALSPGPVRPTMLESASELDLARRSQETKKNKVQAIAKDKTNETERSLAHYTYKTPEGKKESAPVVTQYYPKRIVQPFATIDRHIDPKLMQAATIAQERAHAHSRSLCWHYVKEALLASGIIDSRPKSELAKDAAQDLVSNYGFKKLPVRDPFAAPVGSVLVYGANRAAGHVEIRTKDGFVSDFYSKTPSPRPLLGVYAKL